jgi:hypothetical protein
VKLRLDVGSRWVCLGPVHCHAASWRRRDCRLRCASGHGMLVRGCSRWGLTRAASRTNVCGRVTGGWVWRGACCGGSITLAGSALALDLAASVTGSLVLGDGGGQLQLVVQPLCASDGGTKLGRVLWAEGCGGRTAGHAKRGAMAAGGARRLQGGCARHCTQASDANRRRWHSAAHRMGALLLSAVAGTFRHACMARTSPPLRL